MKKTFIERKRENKLEKIHQKILKDAKNYSEIIVLCLGNYKEDLPFFLKFATLVGTTLKENNFSIYGDKKNPILLDQRCVCPILEKIKQDMQDAFLLVVMTSISENKKDVGNLNYKNQPYLLGDLKIGNATIQLCSSYGKALNPKERYQKYIKNSLNATIIKNMITETSLMLMSAIKEKEEETILESQPMPTLKKEKRTSFI